MGSFSSVNADGAWWTGETIRLDTEPRKPKGGSNPDNSAAGWGAVEGERIWQRGRGFNVNEY